jgi:uncharacterized protein (DUF305 family)
MIPHHSGALLMCREAPITDKEIKGLCDTITAGRQGEINRMNSKLNKVD